MWWCNIFFWFSGINLEIWNFSGIILPDFDVQKKLQVYSQAQRQSRTWGPSNHWTSFFYPKLQTFSALSVVKIFCQLNQNIWKLSKNVTLYSDTSWVGTYNFPLRNIVEHYKITKHCDEANETQTSNNVDDRVFQTKFS